MVYQLWNQPPFAVVARNPAGIKTIKDFEGKTLGGAQGTPTTRLMPVFAALNKLDLSKIKFTTMAPNLQEPMLIQGHMDAAMVFSITSYFNLIGLNQDPDKDYTWFSFADYGMDLYSNGFMVSQKLIKENPKAVAGMVRAVNQANIEVGRNIAGAMDSVMKFDPLVDRAVETRRLKVAYEKLMLSAESKEIGAGDVKDDRLARSIGMVTNVSTSSGPSAGAGVMIWTWTFVTSGTASIGTFCDATAPRRMNTEVSTKTIARRSILHAMRRSINRSSPSGPSRSRSSG
jgi:NitT/TauT family transport system substrate-binding protein